MSRYLLVAVMFLGCAGCVTSRSGKATATWLPEPPTFEAVHADEPIRVDGRLDERTWHRAVTYPLLLPCTRQHDGAPPVQPATVRLAWDEQYVYAAFECQDSDIVAAGDADQLLQHTLGDVVELFLKPADKTWYWEFHVTPRSRKTVFFYPGGGRKGLPSNLTYDCGLLAAATLDGTLNNWRDRDRRWTAELAVPIADLTAQGERFSPETEWRVLAARYNYARHLPHRELSSAPELLRTNFHNLDHYAKLQLLTE